jgi:glutathione synthase/RimK-type ligase-like ATP-grasp enzyme
VILFCGIPDEPPLAMAIAEAERQEVPHVILNQHEATFCGMRLEAAAGVLAGELILQNRGWPLGAFTSVYSRLTDWQSLPDLQRADTRTRRRVQMFHQLLSEWLELGGMHVVNRLAPTTTNMSKPYQAQIITREGFLTPITLVTNDPEEAQRFVREHGRVIYKSASGVRSIVREVSTADLGRLEQVKCLPTQFQAFVSGTNIRVHVIGEEVFASQVETAAVDYRYAGRDSVEVSLAATELPEDVASRCRRLSQRLELPFCGIDLKRTEEGNYYCFEVNPSPAYSYYEQQTGQPIAAALVKYLASFDRRPGAGRGASDEPNCGKLVRTSRSGGGSDRGEPAGVGDGVAASEGEPCRAAVPQLDA